MDFTSSHLDPMESVELRYQGIGVRFYVLKVLSKDLSEILMFRMMECLDDESIVS